MPLHQQGGRRAPVLGDGLPGAQQGVVGERGGRLCPKFIHYFSMGHKDKSISINNLRIPVYALI